MTSMFGGGGGYVQPDSRVLTAITESPNPTAADYADQQKFVETVQRHDYAIKALAQQTQQLQKGVNDATQNPLQQIQQFLADVVILMGGGQLAEGALDFGDLQYILPVLGALFGIGDGPFPLDLFAAAERFFLGYVVPTKQFTDVINTMIGAWMTVFGIDPKFIKDTKALITAIGELFGEVGNLLPSLNGFFGALGLGGSGTGGAALGPLGAALGPIIKLFAGINLSEFGNAIEFITSAIDPFIVQLTAIINFIDEVLHVLSYPGDVINDPLPQLVVPFKNLMRMLGNINLAIDSFNPVAAVQSWLGSLLLPISGWSTVQPNLQIDPGFDDSADVGDAGDGKNWTRENLDPPVTNGDWVWDLIGRTAAGSATVHANGVDHGLLGTVVYVEEGHTFDFDAYLSWTGLTASTGALALHIQTDTGTNTPIASVTSPGATGTWTHLSGSYTVPAGVASIRLRLYVGGGASAGQVWFDDTNIRRTNLLHPGLIQDFEAFLIALGAGDLLAAGSILATGVSNAASAISQLGSLISGVAGSTIVDVVALLNKIQQFIAQWVAALSIAGISSPTNFVELLRGLIPAAAPQFNGTSIATAVEGFVDNLNGTISYTIQEGQNEVAHLIQQADGTVVTAAQVAHQVVAAAQSAQVAVGQAVATGQQMADHGIAAIEGAAVQAGQTAQAYGAALTGAFAGWVNSWTGQKLAQASAPDVSAAAAAAARATSTQAAQTAAINAQLPHFYGGSGTGGLDAQVTFSGSLPGTFTSVSTIAGGSAKYNTAASTDQQTVSGIWSSTDANAKYLLLRANSAFTTYCYVKLQNSTPFTNAPNCEIGCVVLGIRTVLTTFALPDIAGNEVLTANAAYTFEATDYAFSLTGPNGLNIACTDTTPVSRKGPLYVYGGFGTDGTNLNTTTVGAGTLTYNIPAGMVSGDKFDIVEVGGGAGAGAFVGGGYNHPAGGAGGWNGATLTYGTDFPTTTTSFTLTGASGGPGGHTTASPGGASAVAITGYGSSPVTAAGGSPGAADHGLSPGNYTWANVPYFGGAEQDNVTTPASAGLPPGGGGAIPYDGTVGGTGAAGQIWVTARTLTLPGSLASWAFYDSGPSTGPASALVDTNESTTSTSYTDLTTTTDQATVNVGPSGMVIVFLSFFGSNTAAGGGAYMSFDLSGTNTLAASDAYLCSTAQISGQINLGQGVSAAFLLTGLNQGATTIKAKYRSGSGFGGTSSFQHRRATGVPL